MHEEHGAVVELGEQIFGAAAERGDPPALQPRGEAAGERESEDPAARSSTRSIVAPSSTGASPRRTVSTSGSSGIDRRFL